MSLSPNQVIVMERPEWASLPEPEVPYYVLTKDGFFLRKRTLFGDATVPIKVMPESLVKPESGATFVQNGLKFPMWLVLQAHDFFKKVLERHHSEAAVIVTYNMREKKFRLFIPEQYVSYGGVHQRYNPEHLRDGWYAVGTIHSHCDFGAFHSGTDTHDADEMDGLHMTIGMIGKENGPQVATMIAMNKSLFHIKFEEGCDLEARGTEFEETAPEWWFKFVHPNQTAPWITERNKQYQSHGVNPNFGFKPPESVNKGPIVTKNSDGDTIIIPKTLPDGYEDWGHWWRVNGKSKKAQVESTKPRPTQRQLWREEDWDQWWDEVWDESLSTDSRQVEGEDPEEGPFEKNAKVIEEADALLRAAVDILDNAGFRLTYGIVYGGKGKHHA